MDKWKIQMMMMMMNVDLGLYVIIWQLSTAGFCVHQMWRYYSSLCRVLFLSDRGLSMAQFKGAKENR
jgi:hypothetical protein